MRYLFAALLLVACEGPNPDYDPTAAALYWSQGDADVAPDMATSPDLGSPTCGRPGEPCCLDASARRFCTAGACYGERCGVPDLAVVDFAQRPDMTREPGTIGAKCERDEDCVPSELRRVACKVSIDLVYDICCYEIKNDAGVVGGWRCFPPIH